MITDTRINGDINKRYLKYKQNIGNVQDLSDSQIITKCKNECIKKNFEYAGIQDGNECFCSNAKEISDYKFKITQDHLNWKKYYNSDTIKHFISNYDKYDNTKSYRGPIIAVSDKEVDKEEYYKKSKDNKEQIGVGNGWMYSMYFLK